jgi:hypothetical protein
MEFLAVLFYCAALLFTFGILSMAVFGNPLLGFAVALAVAYLSGYYWEWER